MPVQNGKNISILAGETLLIQVFVVDSAGEAVDNISVAKFGLRDSDGVVTTSDCDINIATVSVELTQAETLLMSGKYSYEIRIKDDSGTVDSLITGTITVNSGVITTSI